MDGFHKGGMMEKEIKKAKEPEIKEPEKTIITVDEQILSLRSDIMIRMNNAGLPRAVNQLILENLLMSTQLSNAKGAK